jgi:DNA-binding MltR family transcriptional regulator
MEANQEEQVQYIRSLFNESDRGCMLLVAARLEELLEELHRAYITSVSSSSGKFLDELFRAHAPLSTFASKIQLGRAYGLIEKEAYEDFERLRKLRNGAAHSCVEFSFHTATTRDNIVALQAPKRISSKGIPTFTLTEQEKSAIASPENTPESTKLYLVTTGMCLIIEVMLKLMSILQNNSLRLKPKTNNDDASKIH